MWRALLCTDGKNRVLSTLAELERAVQDDPGTLWVDLFQPTEEENRILSDVFHLDPLVVEDCAAQLQHPKADDHGAYLYLAIHGLGKGARRGEIHTVELDAVLSSRWLITYRFDDMRSVDAAWERCRKQEGFLGRGPDAVLQTVLATQADHYLEEIDRLQEDLLRIEQRLFDGQTYREFVENVFEIKADMSRLRWILGAQREVLHRLSRGEFRQISPSLVMHFRDVSDDIFRATEMIDMLRDLSMAVLETHLTLTANRTNEIMKVLTMISLFILPLTLIVGWFGMNYDNIGGLRFPAAEGLVLAIMALTSFGFRLFLRRRGWL